MKNKLLAALFLFAVVIINCSVSFPKEKLSPMAKLMREMLDYLKEEKLRIEAAKPPLPFPKNFINIRKAKMTSGKMKAKEHQQYMNSFMQELGDYYQAVDSVERRQSFNVLINTCITCHEEECPGPIQAIKIYRF